MMDILPAGILGYVTLKTFYSHSQDCSSPSVRAYFTASASAESSVHEAVQQKKCGPGVHIPWRPWC